MLLPPPPLLLTPLHAQLPGRSNRRHTLSSAGLSHMRAVSSCLVCADGRDPAGRFVRSDERRRLGDDRQGPHTTPIGGGRLCDSDAPLCLSPWHALRSGEGLSSWMTRPPGKVHLNGAYQVTKAAWPYMRDQEYGRVLTVSSPAGLYGNIGQANYGESTTVLLLRCLSLPCLVLLRCLSLPCLGLLRCLLLLVLGGTRRCCTSKRTALHSDGQVRAERADADPRERGRSEEHPSQLHRPAGRECATAFSFALPFAAFPRCCLRGVSLPAGR